MCRVAVRRALNYAPYGFSFKISNNNGSEVYTDTVRADEDEYSFSTGSKFVVKDRDTVVLSLGGLINRTEIVLEFDSPVLLELSLSTRQVYCNKVAFWGKLLLYEGKDDPITCNVRMKYGDYGCAYYYYDIYNYRCNTRSYYVLARVKRVVYTASINKNYNALFTMRVLGVYDGLSLSPRENANLDFPGMHYFSDPVLETTCCGGGEVGPGELQEFSSGSPYNWTRSGYFLHLFNGKYGVGFHAVMGVASSWFTLSFDRIYRVRLNTVDMLNTWNYDARAGSVGISAKMKESNAYYSIKEVHDAFVNSNPVPAEAVTSGLKWSWGLQSYVMYFGSGPLYLLRF